MRRIWAVCAALVLLAGCGAGCSGPSAPDQGEIKQAFIRQLIGFCAEVDRQLANIDMKRQPGIYADQLGRFVDQARSQPPPDADRAQFDILLTEMDGTVRQFRAAQTALAADDQPAYQEALAQAKRQLGSADAAAQKYGMPPLNSCPKHESPAPSPSTPAPAAAWQPRHASLTAVQQMNAAVLDGRILVAGGLTTSTKATAATQSYDPTKDAWQPGPSLPEAPRSPPMRPRTPAAAAAAAIAAGGHSDRGPRGGRDHTPATTSVAFWLVVARSHVVQDPPGHICWCLATGVFDGRRVAVKTSV